MRYVPALDGLRAVAILGVLVFHAWPGSLRGGFTGVDVFFVLSGYLIASILLREIREGGLSMREFYLRRIQRLLPNAVLMVLVTLAAAYAFLLPSAVARVGTHGLWTLFNLSNVHVWRRVGGYWGDAAASAPLLHTWSLGVEEQFYLLFPATLWLLWLLSGRARGRLVALLALGALGSLALALRGASTHPVATFYLLPTRAWEPLLGAALAAYRLPRSADRPPRTFGPSPLKTVAGWSGLAMIAAGFLLVVEGRGFPGVTALLPTAGALAVVASAADGENGVSRLLSRPLLVILGRLSYSIYLWHWPFLVIGRSYAELHGLSRQAGALVGVAAGVLLSLVAYRVVEEPLRQRGPGRSRRLLVTAAGFSVAVIATVAASLGRPVPDPLGLFDRPVFRGLHYDVADAAPADRGVAATNEGDVVFPPAPPHPPEVWRTGGIVHDWGRQAPRVVVLGSSHALMYGSVIDDVCKELGVSVAFLSADNTAVFFSASVGPHFPTVERARDFDDARRRWVGDWRPDAVVAIEKWDRWEPGDLERQLRAFVRELEPRARWIILLGQVPVLRVGETVNLREFVTWRLRRDGSLPRIPPDAREPVRRAAIAAIEGVAREHPAVRLLRVDEAFHREDGSVRYSSGRSFLYADDNHLSEAGAESVREPIRGALAAACGR